MFVAKVHMVFLLRQLVYFAEFIHIELAHEGREVPVPEKVRQNLFFKFFAVFYQNFVVSVPAQVIMIVADLNAKCLTSRMW